MGWLARLLGSQLPPSRLPPAAAAAAAPRGAAASQPPLVPAEPVSPPIVPPPLLGWLLGARVEAEAETSGEQLRALGVLDEVLVRSRFPNDLLPRAASVVPQLIAMLRQGDLPVPVLAERIAKDPAIAAEVLRLASNAYYRAQQEVTDLGRAISVLGAAGLQIAITRIVLRPLYQAQSGSLTARAAPRLWEYSDALARHAAEVAPAAGSSAFDGYLAGLLHGTGWTVLLRALDVASVTLPAQLGIQGAAAFEQRAHRLFGLAAAPWDITPGFAALARDARLHPLADSSLPLADALRRAQPAVLAKLSTSN